MNAKIVYDLKDLYISDRVGIFYKGQQSIYLHGLTRKSSKEIQMISVLY